MYWVEERQHTCHKLLESETDSHSVRLALCDPMDYSLPGSSVPEILQARVLEWVAISFSNLADRIKLFRS